ncbi:MAG: hypothetical protein E7387_06830 [Ruminococcaceae bacterium]|nr:hypothetical protein [Oscillospiraceae bacterium]
MQKSLYSLMLMDDVVRAIDNLALQQNTNRSNLVNQILAEYVSMTTPEMRVNNIFKSIEDLINQCGMNIIPYVSPNQMTMSLKSSLEYKYRPTIKYEVSLYRTPQSAAIGELDVVFRTQSEELIRAMTEFFRLWTTIESAYRRDVKITYALYDGRFTRSINVSPDRNYTSEELGNNISSYIQIFDKLVKGYVSGSYMPRDVEMIYLEYYNKGVGLI